MTMGTLDEVMFDLNIIGVIFTSHEAFPMKASLSSSAGRDSFVTGLRTGVITIKNQARYKMNISYNLKLLMISSYPAPEYLGYCANLSKPRLTCCNPDVARCGSNALNQQHARR